MITRVLRVENEQGLHARPAAAIAKMVSDFSSQGSKVLIGKSEDNLVDASSVLEILSLKVKNGEDLVVAFDETFEVEGFLDSLRVILSKK